MEIMRGPTIAGLSARLLKTLDEEGGGGGASATTGETTGEEN